MHQIVENLSAMAAQAYALADKHCTACRNFHALWPYRRIARMCGAAESGQAQIEQTMTRFIGLGARRLLIAGAADTGLLTSVARAGRGFDTEITVVDRCETPIELCRHFAQECRFQIHALVADLTELDAVGFDLIYSNSILQFIPAERRVDMLSRLCKALRPGGHLLMVYNTGGRFAGEILPEYRGGYAEWLLAELDRQNIPLPASREGFRKRVDDYTRELESREGAFESPDRVDSMMVAAGFTVNRRDQIDMPLALPFQDLVAKLSKRRFLAVAQSPID